MDDSFLVRMLDRVADLDEQLQASAGRQEMSVAIIGDFDALDQFHHKIGPPASGRAGIEDVSDVWMFHQGQRLALGLKTRNDAVRIHSRFDQLQGDAPQDRFLLLSHENHAASAFSDLLQ